MKKIIVKTAIIFSIAIIGIFNLTLFTDNGSISGLNLNKLLTQAVAACENPGDVYSYSNTGNFSWPSATAFWYEYVSFTSSQGFAGGPGCICAETKKTYSCGRSFDITEFCNPHEETGKSCN